MTSPSSRRPERQPDDSGAALVVSFAWLGRNLIGAVSTYRNFQRHAPASGPDRAVMIGRLVTQADAELNQALALSA